MRKSYFLGGALAVAALGAILLASQRQPAAAPATSDSGLARATFAGGCFWCMEPPYDKLDGVVATTSGYTGGRLKNPTYQQVGSGRTDHLEAVEVLFDPEKVSYETLLEVFWKNVDPTDGGGQFCDRGEHYTTAIFVHDEEQRQQATASKRALIDSHRIAEPIVTPIRTATAFYPAEEYHQDYYLNHPIRYKFYRRGCGRDRVLERLWGKTDS